MEKQPLNNRHSVSKFAPKPYMMLSRWGASGWLLSFCVLAGCMFVIGVIIGRNTAPVFDMEQIDARMVHLKNSGFAQIERGIEAAQKKRERYLEVARNIDIFDSLKEKGKNLLPQNIPPVKSPTDDTNAKPKEERAPSAQPPAQQTETAMETQPAVAPPGEQPAQGNMTLASAPQPSQSDQLSTKQESPQEVKETGTTAGDAQPTEKAPEYAQADVKAVDKKDVQEAAVAENKSAGAELEKTNTQQKKEAAPQDPSQEAKESKPSETGRQFTIQVASLKEMDKANIVMEKFKQKGYPAYCQTSPVRGEVWHRVRIGPYPDKAIAESDCNRLKDAGFDPLLLIVDR